MGLYKKIETAVFVVIVLTASIYGVQIVREEIVKNEYYTTNIEAEKGNISSQYRLGMMYQIGWAGIERDRDLALKWYGRAARQGSEIAIEMLCNDFGDCRNQPNNE